MTRSVFNLVIVVFILGVTGCDTREGSTTELKRVYFKDGKTLQQTVEYKNGKKNGYLIEYYKTGILKARQFYINDTLNDTSAIYYPDGRLQSLHVYKNKLKHGCWKEYNKKGKLYSEIHMKNGLPDSTSVIYNYKTGKVLTRVTYVDGVKNGLEEKYYANGKPQSKAYYDKGRPCIDLEEWYDSGKKINNEFRVLVTEKDELMLNNTVRYYIKPENLRSTDKAYLILPPVKGKGVEVFKTLSSTPYGFELEYTIAKGDYIMNKEYVAVFRKTGFGNTFIKTHVINVAVNNY